VLHRGCPSCSSTSPNASSGWRAVHLGACGPDTAEGIVRAVIDFTQQFLTEDHEDVADTLRQLEAVGMGQALDAHPAPTGAQPVRLTAVWCAPSVPAHRTRRATGGGFPYHAPP
jgi:hypothetical protein